jgi:hypothetical protein
MQDLKTKLQLKGTNRLALINAPAQQTEAIKNALPEVEIAIDEKVNQSALILFVNNRSEVQKFMPSVGEWLIRGGLLWVAYPKTAARGGTDINRDSLWKQIEPFGWRPVRQIALDEVWSALRFVSSEISDK